VAAHVHARPRLCTADRAAAAGQAPHRPPARAGLASRPCQRVHGASRQRRA
jgi:hypothetical protein